MKKQIMISMVVATMVIGMVGCGSDGTKKVDDNVTPPAGNQNPSGGNQNPGGGNQSSNLDIVEKDDLKIVRNIQSGDIELSFKHAADEKIIEFYVDIDNNENTGSYSDSSESTNGTEFRIVNHTTDQAQRKIYEVNTTDNSKWSVSNKVVTYNVNGNITLTSDIVPTKYFSVDAVSYEINATNNVDWVWKKEENALFDLKIVDSNPTLITGNNGLSMKIDNNDTDISIQLFGNGYNEFSRLYIDSDDNNETGYAGLGLWKNYGADYSIGNIIQKYGDAGWSDSGTYKHLEKGGVIKLNLKKSDLNITTGTIKLGLALHKDNNLDDNISGSIPAVNGVYNEAKTLGAEYILK